MTDAKTQCIAALNDLFRRGGPSSKVPGRMFTTAGVSALSDEAQILMLRQVSGFEAFTEDNDPHGEHDFGSFEIEGQRLFWKIDYYADAAMELGSEDPADPSQCFRVLTVMLASEY